jgi:hypothetical protein
MQLNVKVQIDNSDYIADTVIFITLPNVVVVEFLPLLYVYEVYNSSLSPESSHPN